eukprot:835420-Pleurochrysis_carterae.AAC.1
MPMSSTGVHQGLCLLRLSAPLEGTTRALPVRPRALSPTVRASCAAVRDRRRSACLCASHTHALRPAC